MDAERNQDQSTGENSLSEAATFIWIDTIRLTGKDKALMNVYSHNPHFDRPEKAYRDRFRQMVECFR
jgi:hypothetical protein